MPRSALLMIIAVMTLAASPPLRGEPVRGVVELFTSQGCSSCPPADALLKTLSTEPGLVTLSLPVDYWDRLGWKDTFGSPAFSSRQRAYARGRGDGEVYTPQAVIGGAIHTNGASQSTIAAALAELSGSLVVPITITRAGEQLSVTIGSAGSIRLPAATILLMPTLAERSVAIGRGENADRNVTYTNVVRRIDDLGIWTGDPIAPSIALSTLEGHDGVTVLLQQGTLAAPGPILGAAHLDLR